MSTLYSIGTDLLNLSALLDACEGDLSRAPEGEAEVTAWLESIEADQAAKLDGYLNYLSQLDMEAGQCKAEAEQWRERQSRRESRAAMLRANLLAHLERTGQAKVRTACGKTIAVVVNGGVVPVIIDPDAAMDPARLPEDYRSVTYRANAIAIRKALEAGVELGWARLGEKGRHLRVR